MADQLIFQGLRFTTSCPGRPPLVIGAVAGGERLRPGSCGPPVWGTKDADRRRGVRRGGNARARRGHRVAAGGRGGRGAGYSAAMIASNSARSRSSSSCNPRNGVHSAVSTDAMELTPLSSGMGAVRRRGVAGSAVPAGRWRSFGAWPSRPLESSTSAPHRHTPPGLVRCPGCHPESVAG